MTAEKLQQFSVQTLGIIATNAERARLYFRFRPPRVPIGADPDLTIHRAYRLPQTTKTSEIMDILHSRWTDLARELKLNAAPDRTYDALNQVDAFTPAKTDEQERAQHQIQFVDQFLIDRDGIVRWANVECAREGLTGLDDFPTDDEFLTAARAL